MGNKKVNSTSLSALSADTPAAELVKVIQTLHSQIEHLEEQVANLSKDYEGVKQNYDVMKQDYESLKQECADLKAAEQQWISDRKDAEQAKLKLTLCEEYNAKFTSWLSKNSDEN